MSATAPAPSRNGDGPKPDNGRYRTAVKAKMKKRDPVAGRIEPSEAEVDQFLLECQVYGLEPLVDQIYAAWQNGEMKAVTTMDGLRVLSARTGSDDGEDDPEWCDAEGNWRNFWGGEGHPTAARVRVYRKGARRPFTGIANWSDFAPSRAEGAGMLWDEDSGMPAHLLCMRGEGIARRKAFPAELSGLYAAEELELSPAEIGAAPEDPPGAPPIAVDVPAAPAPPPSAPPPATPPAAPSPPPPAGEAPAVIVDPAEGQPSGAPARPGVRRTLAEALEGGDYSRLRGELTEALFDQLPDRLTDEQSGRLAAALAEAEEAGITPVELERTCKIARRRGEGKVEVRSQAILEWIAERRRRAAAGAGAPAEAEDPAGRPATPEGRQVAAGPGEGTEEGQADRGRSLLDADPGPEEER